MPGDFTVKYDNNGLIVQADLDGGDTAGREGDYWFYQGLKKDPQVNPTEFDRVLKLLQVRPGVFIRNPIRYNDPKDFSRDQQTSIILALGEMEKYDVLKTLLGNQLRNFGLYPNGDIATPEDWGLYIRAFKAWYLYPALLVGDTFMLANSLIRLYKGKNTDDVSDDVNHTLILLQAQYHMATPISFLARKLYKLIKGGIQTRWSWYFRPETGANPFDELYRDLISRM